MKTASENLEHSDFFHCTKKLSVCFLISNNIVSVHQTFSSKPLNPVDINDYCMFHIESEAKLWADLSHSSFPSKINTKKQKKKKIEMSDNKSYISALIHFNQT